MFSEKVCFSLKFNELFGKSTNYTLGKRSSFSQNSQKMTPCFLKVCVFREHSVIVCVFRGNLVNSWENLQILPLGNVCLFRRIRKHDTMFSDNLCFSVEFNEFVGKSTNSTLGKRASFSQNSQKFTFSPKTSSTLGKHASFSQNSQT